MKKHSYRQIDIAKADWAAIRTKTENHAIIFSVDMGMDMGKGDASLYWLLRINGVD